MVGGAVAELGGLRTAAFVGKAILVTAALVLVFSPLRGARDLEEAEIRSRRVS